jgi:hypothetical protein
VSGRTGGATTGRIKREMALERHEQAVHLLDVEAMRRVLSGSPAFLTHAEREAVFVLADSDGIDRHVVAAGLGMSRDALDWAVLRRRKRSSELDRDLQAAAAIRPAAELVDAVAAESPDAVAAVLTGLSPQQFAALCVVLAARVVDAETEGREQVAA